MQIQTYNIWKSFIRPSSTVKILPHPWINTHAYKRTSNRFTPFCIFVVRVSWFTAQSEFLLHYLVNHNRRRIKKQRLFPPAFRLFASQIIYSRRDVFLFQIPQGTSMPIRHLTRCLDGAHQTVPSGATSNGRYK